LGIFLRIRHSVMVNDIRSWLVRMGRSEIAWGICAGVFLGIGLAVFLVKADSSKYGARWPSAPNAIVTSALSRQASDVGMESAADDVRYMANWIAESRDALGLPFVIVDKKNAKVYVFDTDARLRGASPVLLGSASGDDTVPGIGSRPTEQVLPEERTTPAGRFVGERGHNARGEDVVWVDYDAGVSMHRVLTTNPAERRLERIESAEKQDKRISYGCINVPAAFYEAHLQPVFAGHRAIIYVLPEIKSLDEVFGSYDVAAAGTRTFNPAKITSRLLERI